jgi:thiamine phosphate synthase YjbQ (UPF0047 family)
MRERAMTTIRVRSTCREEIIDITAQVQDGRGEIGHRSGLVAGFSQVLLVEDGVLGEWQQVWLEFDGPHEREVWLKVIPG